MNDLFDASRKSPPADNMELQEAQQLKELGGAEKDGFLNVASRVVKLVDPVANRIIYASQSKGYRRSPDNG